MTVRPLSLLAVLVLLAPAARADDSTAGVRPKITFGVNVHDFVNLDESADTVLALVALFEEHGVAGDFYLTGPIVQAYLDRRPDVIERLKASRMTISYHVRAPHPLCEGFGDALRGQDDEGLRRVLEEYETHRLDLTTGKPIADQPGGYALLAKVFGRPPVTVSPQNGNPHIRAAAFDVWREMGAKVCIAYHESGTDPERPFAYDHGLLVRPSDFSVTRWTVGGSGREAFWWNMLDTPRAEAYDPVRYLDLNLALWDGSRPPIVTALVHEDNFYRRGGTPFANIYYEDAEKTRARRPPFDLAAPDPSRPRTDENRRQILAAYGTLVAHAAERCDIVTSADLAVLAEAAKE